MKKVDIRTIHEREFDLNTYTDEARERAEHLFERYERYQEKANQFHEKVITNLFNESCDLYIDKRTLYIEKLEEIELELIRLDKDPRNQRGVTFEKIMYFIKSYFDSKWYHLTFAIGWLVVVVMEFTTHNPNFSTPLVCLEIFLVAMFGYNFYSMHKKSKLTKFHTNFKGMSK